jgi:PLD-like domain
MAGSGSGFKRARAGALLDIARDDLIESVRRARRRSWLTSPFLSNAVAKLIAEAAKFSGARDLRFITALGADPVRRGVLSVRGLETLRVAGFELRSVPNLHAKTAVIDDSWGLAGSGNLTASGLGTQNGGNVELGVVLSRSQVSTAARHFSAWWTSAKPILEDDIADYWRWAPKRVSGQASVRDRGPVHGTPILASAGRELSRLRAEQASRNPDRGYWLKMLYYDERDLDRWWEKMTWVSDVHRLRDRDGEPLLRPSYRIGDLLVLYLVGHACPAIAEVKKKSVFDPARVERGSNRSDANRWGWLTEVRVIHKTDTGLEGAPELDLLGVDPSSVRQHGHIRISSNVYARALRALDA